VHITLRYTNTEFIMQPTLPSTGFLRLPEILKFIPVSKSTWWSGTKTGRFPKPVKLSDRVTVWRVEDIQALIAKYEDKGSDS
jgi:prophage regulatory protein